MDVRADSQLGRTDPGPVSFIGPAARAPGIHSRCDSRTKAGGLSRNPDGRHGIDMGMVVHQSRSHITACRIDLADRPVADPGSAFRILLPSARISAWTMVPSSAFTTVPFLISSVSIFFSSLRLPLSLVNAPFQDLSQGFCPFFQKGWPFSLIHKRPVIIPILRDPFQHI